VTIDHVVDLDCSVFDRPHSEECFLSPPSQPNKVRSGVLCLYRHDCRDTHTSIRLVRLLSRIDIG